MSFLKRFGPKSRERNLVTDPCQNEDPDFVGLEDDDRDSFTVNISGTLDLSIVADDSNAASSNNLGTYSPEVIAFDGGDQPDLTTSRVSFEITSAEVVRDQRSSYVLYTILVTSGCGVEKTPTTIDRRYSDFERLHSLLKKKYSSIMSDFSFPRKVLVGNFSSETIAHRSRSFEQYLSHVFSVYELRYSNEFASFFYLTDAQEAYVCLCNEQYLDAISIFEKCLPISEKLYGGNHLRVISLLHALVVCFHATENLKTAQMYAEAALKNTRELPTDEPSIALIKLSIRLCWSLGKDKQDLERKLQDLKARKINVDSIPDLKDIIKLNTLI